MIPCYMILRIESLIRCGVFHIHVPFLTCMFGWIEHFDPKFIYRRCGNGWIRFQLFNRIFGIGHEC